MTFAKETNKRLALLYPEKIQKRNVLKMREYRKLHPEYNKEKLKELKSGIFWGHL